LKTAGEDAPPQRLDDGIDSGGRVTHNPASRTHAYSGHALFGLTK
jgi:hypothetical protein